MAACDKSQWVSRVKECLESKFRSPSFESNVYSKLEVKSYLSLCYHDNCLVYLYIFPEIPETPIQVFNEDGCIVELLFYAEFSNVLLVNARVHGGSESFVNFVLKQPQVSKTLCKKPISGVIIHPCYMTAA
jgi:hypothetical protein